MNKKKLSLVAVTFCAVALTTGILIGANGQFGFGNLAEAESSDTYKLVLNKDNQLTSAEQTAGNFTRNTSEGNAIAFTHSGAQFYEGTGFFQTHANGAYIANSTPISGLRSIKIKGNDDVGNNRTYSILFGNASGEYIYSSENLVSNKSQVQEYVVPQYETPFSYFKLQATQGGWTHFISVEIVYTCSSTLANRGQTFDSTGKSYDFSTPVEVSDGVINVDVKWTDLGASNGKVAIGFFGGEGWSTSFGYKNANAGSKTGDVPGLTVLHLSDGYTRFSWKLSEMVNTSENPTPTSVNVVHMRNGWTESEGYFDVNTSASVVEFKGTKFVSTENLTIELDSAVSFATGKIQMDLYFTSIGKATFAINNDWDNYYGYFDITPIGNNNSVWGIQVVSQCNGFVRVTIEQSKLSSGKKVGTPTEFDFVYLRKGWTTASGYVDVTVLSY